MKELYVAVIFDFERGPNSKETLEMRAFDDSESAHNWAYPQVMEYRADIDYQHHDIRHEVRRVPHGT